MIKILLYSQIINRIFNFTLNFSIGLTPENIQFVPASNTLIIFSTFLCVLFTRGKNNVKQGKNLTVYLIILLSWIEHIS